MDQFELFVGRTDQFGAVVAIVVVVVVISLQVNLDCHLQIVQRFYAQNTSSHFNDRPFQRYPNSFIFLFAFLAEINTKLLTI